MKKLVTLMMLVAMVGMVASSAQADTLGYWRFEDTPISGVFQDSSTYDNDLTSSGTLTHDTLSNLGVSFDNPVPQTSAANAKALDAFGGNHIPGQTPPDGSYRLYCADQTEFTLGTAGSKAFTIEAYVRLGANADTGYIASQYLTTGDKRSWGLFYDRGLGKLKGVFSATGTFATAVTITTTLSPTRGVDYFVAMSYDESDAGLTGAKFYLKNLSTGVWTTYANDHGINAGETLYDTDTDFNIGSYNNGTGGLLDGVIDEVRFSNTVLSQDDLLASVPEPATMTLLLLGLPFALRRRR